MVSGFTMKSVILLIVFFLEKKIIWPLNQTYWDSHWMIFCQILRGSPVPTEISLNSQNLIFFT